MVSAKSHGKLENERNKIITRLRDVENEIALYENNIGFFAKSKNAESMINDIQKKIDNAKNEAEQINQQIIQYEKASKKIQN